MGISPLEGRVKPHTEAKAILLLSANVKPANKLLI